jgi:hypothetical protein
MDWFRMYNEFASDAKVQSMPEAMQRRLVMLLCLRCSNALVTLQDDEIAFALRISDHELAETKALFMRKGFIDEAWEIANWDKRQFASDSSAARVAKHRAAKKVNLQESQKEEEIPCNVTVTPQNRTDTEQIQNRTEAEQTRPEKPVAAPENPEPTAKPEKFEPESKETWLAYGEAYKARYGVYPVRNAPVNTAMAAFVKRVGKAEGPGIAAFYVLHNSRFYVQAMHPVKVLLSDAEKLRTEWATNRTVTATQATQADRTQTNFNAFAPLIEAARAKEAMESSNA